MNTSMDTLMIQIESTTKNATSSIQTLINKLNQLNKSLEQVANQSKNFSKLKTALSGTTTVSTPKVTKQKQPFAEYGSLTKQLKDLGVYGKSLSKLSVSDDSITKTIKYKTAMGDLVTVIRKTKDDLVGYKVTLKDVNKETKNVMDSFKNVKINDSFYNISGLGTSLNKQKSYIIDYQQQLNSLGLSANNLGKVQSVTRTATSTTTKYKNEMGQLITVVQKTKNGLDSYKVTLKDVNKETKNIVDVFKSLTSSFSTTLLNVNLLWNNVKSMVSTMGDFVNQAASYYESLNLFSTTLGENSEEAMEWVNKFSDALYLDPGQVMQYMGTFDSLISGLGVGEEKAYLMSQQLTQLTYDLASFKNLSFETAFEKLQSGISGEIFCLVRKGLRTVTHLIQWTSKHVMV